MNVFRAAGMAFALLMLTGPARAFAQVEAPPRIVVLVPSFADDLSALHAERAVVGVSAYTDGAAYAGLPRVAEFQSVDVERIVALHPTAVFGIPSQRKYVAPLESAGIPVHLVSDDTFDDIFTDLHALARAAGKEAAAADLERSLRAKTADLRRRTAHFRRKPAVFVVLGTAPIWSAGPRTYIGTLISFAGGRDAAPALGAGWGEYSAEALLQAQPDALIATDDAHLDQVLEREPWRSLHAVQQHHVFVLHDANALYRPGPRYNDGLQWLIERLTPLST